MTWRSGAQIMGDGITGERFHFLVGGLQFRRAFGDALLQVRVETAYFAFRFFALDDFLLQLEVR